MKVRYITICDSKYVAPALALYRSLNHVSNHSLGIYTLDGDAANYLNHLDLQGAQVFRPHDYIPEHIMQLHKTRSSGAFAFTVKPVALMHAMENDPDVDWVGYVDVDIWFFADPAMILKVLPSHKSACFTPHRFSPSFLHYEPTVGRYNAGYVSFKNDTEGRRVLEHWRNMCIEWCQDYVDGHRYGDQKYLGGLADQYSAVVSCSHKGANAAPWNIADARVHARKDQVFIDDDPLLFYHFQGLKVYGPRLFDLYASTELIVSGNLLALVYAPYVESLHAAYRELMVAAGWQPVYTHRSLRRRLHIFIQRALGGQLNLYHV